MKTNEIEVRVPDPWKQGLASGWNVTNASALENDTTLECDVVVVGSGAGGGTTAEILTQAGLAVLIVEEGILKTSDQFTMNEREAYRDLYQEGLARGTKDGAIGVIQGRSVGGSTTVNWTSSFRTPDNTLNHWAEHFGVKGVAPAEMAPWFDHMEARLNIHPWAMPPNTNNNILRVGCEKLGYHWAIIPRNVNGCWNLGYCGMGCPTNAKQSMLVTTIPAALSGGAKLVWRLRAERVTMQGDRVTGVECVALTADGQTTTGRKVSIRARHTVLSGGGINTPGLLLRSRVPDPYQRVGKRTFLHAGPCSVAQFGDEVESYYGAPQSVYSDHFLWPEGVGGPMGFKLEVAPLHPGFAAVLMGTHGKQNLDDMQHLSNVNTMAALMRDGFHEDSPGGNVELRDDGSPVLDYPVTEYHLEAARHAHDVMLQVQFAAGAKRVRPATSNPLWFTSLSEARRALKAQQYSAHHTKIASAHVMGGSCMGEDPKIAVCNSQGRYHHLQDISVLDGSLFPTSIGANPQLSVYGLTSRLATALAADLKGSSQPVAQPMPKPA